MTPPHDVAPPRSSAARSRDPILIGLMAAFTAWALAFIQRTSFLSDSGRRTYCLFDDAMVSMRYAWNLSHGLGLVWNAGQRVEGYTNPLMTLVMAGATAFDNHDVAVLLVQLAAIPTLLGAALLASYVADELAAGSLPDSAAAAFRRLAFFSALAYYPLAYWTLLGMETGLLTLTLLGAVWFFLRHERTGDARDRLGFGLASGLAYLARPDALVATVPLLAMLIARAAFPHRRWSSVLQAVGAYAGLPLLHLAWRWAYYGQLTPNTYLLKLGGFPLAMRLANGSEFLWLFLQETWLAVGLGLASTFLRPRRAVLAVASLPVCLGAYQVWTGGDAWRHWRLLAPAVPLLLILAARLALLLARPPRPDGERPGRPSPVTLLRVALVAAAAGLFFVAWRPGSLADLAISKRGRSLLVLWGVVLLAVVWLAGRTRSTRILLATLAVAALAFSTDLRFARAITLSKPAYQVGANADHLRIARALDALLGPEATVGVLWAGAIPYFTGRPAIDFLGKADAHIAALPPHLPPGPPQWGRVSWLPGHEKYDLAYSIQALRPTYVQRCRWGVQDVCAWVAQEYVSVSFRGAHLLLRRDAPEVDWTKLSRAAHAPNSSRAPSGSEDASAEPE